jgi:hypothetical protein
MGTGVCSAPDILDLCSSWLSHYPDNRDYGNVVGIGMNEHELSRNGVSVFYLVRNSATLRPKFAVAVDSVYRARPQQADPAAAVQRYV